MKVRKEMIKNLEVLGFKDSSLYNDDDDDYICSYYDKNFGEGKFIRVGSPYVYSNTLEFHHSVGDFGNDEEITDCVPIWAFSTIVKMVQMGFIED